MGSKLIESFDLNYYVYEVYDDKPAFDHIELNQIHSDKVISHDKWQIDTKADGIYVRGELEGALAIRTADCLPIALVGSLGTANIHAGWRGLYTPILNNSSLKELNIHTAVIGPHISSRKYEVGEEFKKYFPKFLNEENGSFYLSLSDVARDQLLEYYGQIEIYESKLCTYEHARLNSFRLNKTEKRNYNILRKNRGSNEKKPIRKTII